MELYYIAVFFGLGLIFGSFLNALEWRFRHKISIFDKRSKCPKCKKNIKWQDNIPVISFILLKRKCRNCHEKISWQYPVVELWMGLSFVLFYFYHEALNIVLICDLIAVWFLTFVFIYDLKYMEVLDKIALVGALIFLLLNGLFGIFSWSNLLIGGLVGFGFFFLQYVISRGRWIGGGDLRIGVLMGFLLGWPDIILGLFLAYIIGSVFSVTMVLLKKKKMTDQTPFGTYLTVGTLVTLVWGEKIVGWYVGLLN